MTNATEIDPGFETESLAALSVNVGSVGYGPEQGEQYFDRALERMRGLPGVRHAALTTGVPISNGIQMLRTFFVHGRDPEGENNRVMVPVNTVSEGYFRTAGIELRSGRDFASTDHSDAPSVAIVNETTAERFWPGEDAVGKRFFFINEERTSAP